MKLTFDKQLALRYKSPSQKIRILTEHWVDNAIFCPNCGYYKMEKYPNNRPAADFYCLNCREDYELKSKQNSLGTKINDGAYRTMLDRLMSRNNPNLFLLNYNMDKLEVTDFLVIPKHYFIPQIIEKRKPLSEQARRAGWTGCNILLNNIPRTGKIFLIRNRQVIPKDTVLLEWKKTLFLREEKEIHAKGWLLNIMRIIDNLEMSEFDLNDIYTFEGELSEIYPDNHHIKDKIRQQLQILRDKGYLRFESRGHYKIL